MSTQYDSTGPLTAEQAASLNFEPPMFGAR